MGLKRLAILALTACALAGPGAVAPARAATVAVDQNNASVGGNFCYISTRNLCGQSFTQTGDTLAGAGIFLGSLFLNLRQAVTLSVFSSYGSTPRGLLASGTQVTGSAGWVDVFWDAIKVTPGQTYYLVASNASLFSPTATYSIGNSYAGGNTLYAGSTRNYRNYDLTFRTFAGVPQVIETPPTNLPAAVPLPASLTLLLAALGSMGFMHWRRRRVV